MTKDGSDNNDTERLVAEVPPELKRMLKQDERNIKDIVESALWREFGDEEYQALKRRKQTRERKVQRITHEIEDLKDERRSARREIERIQAKIEEYEQRQDTYEDLLTDLEALLHDGVCVFEDHKKVKEAAEVGNTQPEAVIDELKDRNPDIPDRQFEDNL